MYKFTLITRQLMLVSTLLLSGFTVAAEEHASIHFVNHGGIRDWQSDDKDGLYVQDNHKNWYYATFWMPCFDLPFEVSIGFVTTGFDDLDKYSSVIVGNGRCTFKTFEKSEAPPPREKSKKAKAKDDKAQAGSEPAATTDAKPQE